MKKGMIVVDIPENCAKCDLYQEDSGDYYCFITNNEIEKQESNQKKPVWCPIKPLPEKITINFTDFFKTITEYNMYINKITDNSNRGE